MAWHGMVSEAEGIDRPGCVLGSCLLACEGGEKGIAMEGSLACCDRGGYEFRSLEGLYRIGLWPVWGISRMRFAVV